MDNPVLLLWLDGPMQSWGTRAHWDVRDTALEPTKSGIIGLLGCALGLARENPELEALDRDIRFGVRIDRPGVVSTDYQTVSAYHPTAAGAFKHLGGTAKALSSAMQHPEATIVSPRDYLHDAVFLVALQVPRDRLHALREALEAPHWPLYLGRKGCPPAAPLLDKTPDEYATLSEALESRERHTRALRDKKLRAYVEDAQGELERQDALRIDRLRMYGFRQCRYLEVDPPCTSHA